MWVLETWIQILVFGEQVLYWLSRFVCLPGDHLNLCPLHMTSVVPSVKLHQTVCCKNWEGFNGRSWEAGRRELEGGGLLNLGPGNSDHVILVLLLPFLLWRKLCVAPYVCDPFFFFFFYLVIPASTNARKIVGEMALWIRVSSWC